MFFSPDFQQNVCNSLCEENLSIPQMSWKIYFPFQFFELPMCSGSPGLRPLSVGPIMSALQHQHSTAPSPPPSPPSNVSDNSFLDHVAKVDGMDFHSLLHSLSLMESGGLVVIVDMGLAVIRFHLIPFTITIIILSVVMNLIVLTAMKERELAVGVVTKHPESFLSSFSIFIIRI